MKQKKTIVITAMITCLSTLVLVYGGFVVYRSPYVTQLSSALKGEYSETSVQRIADIIDNYYYEDVDEEKIYKGAIKGMIDALNDEYSAFVDEEEYQSLMSDLSGEFKGIGVQVSIDDEDGLITVIAPIEDTPAYRAGIKTGDKIIAVNGIPVGLDNYGEAIEMMRGSEEDETDDVKITLVRRETGNTEDITVTREVIVTKSVKSRLLDGNVGYIRITNFDENTAADFAQHLDILGAEKLDGMVIDLRGNPGGIIDTTHEIADMLLPKGMFVYFEYKDGSREEYKCDDEYYDFPLAVIVNGGSASASEAFAGAVKDTGRGVLVGEKTFGKGVVQTIMPFMYTENGNTAVKLTTSRYFTPKGHCIHGQGLNPDIEVEPNPETEGMTYTQISLENDPQLKAAWDHVTQLIRQ